jgi:hypothetical protein
VKRRCCCGGSTASAMARSISSSSTAQACQIRGILLWQGIMWWQASDATRSRQRPDLVEQCKHGETAIRHKDHCSGWHPAHHPLDNLPRPRYQGLMTASPLLRESLRRAQHRQKGQRPYALGPLHLRQQQTTQPAQPTGFHKMRLRRPYGVAVNAFGGDAVAPAPCNRVIQAAYHCSCGDEDGDQQRQQQPTGGQRRPDRPIEDPVGCLKVFLRAPSHDSQGGSDRALAWGKYRPSD